MEGTTKTFIDTMLDIIMGQVSGDDILESYNYYGIFCNQWLWYRPWDGKQFSLEEH